MWVPLLIFGACSAPPPPPNIVIVTMDTTRADAIGAFGAPTVGTPTWDALAAKGTRFTRAYTVTPLTIPAHSSLMTGQFPPRHGVRDNGDYFLSDDAHTLAERLHDAGYATMASVGAEVTSHHWGFAQGFDAFFDEMGDARDREENRWRIERRGDKVVDDALGWLQSRDRERPFFAWVHLFDAHTPYEPPEPYASKFKSPYIAEIAYADAQLARLVDALRASGDLDRTWIIVTADHGEGLGSHGEAMHGVLLYDATTRVPLVVRAPGGDTGGAVPFPTSLVDLAPTVLAAAGLPTDPSMDGIDLGPWIRDPSAAAPPDRVVYAESLYAFHHYGWAPQRALVDATHKLIDSTTPELYARDDAHEKSDLSLTTPDRVVSLQQRLEALAAGMTPSGAAKEAQLSSEQLAQLEALGYLGEATGDAADPATAKGLPDPVDRLPVLKEVERARQALQRGDLVEARAGLEAVRASEPGLEEPRRLLVSVLLRAGDVPAAAALAEQNLADTPTTGARIALAQVRLRQARPADAIALYHEALDVDAYLADAWGPYLHLLFVTGDPRFPGALDRAAANVPDEPVVTAMRGVAAAARGDLVGARPLLEQAIARDPRQPLAHHYLGVVALAAGQTDLAESSFQEEIALAPPGVPSRQMLVRIYADQRRYDEQLAELVVIEQHEPPSPLTLHSIAQALFNVGRYPEAAVRVRDCRTLAPDYAGCAMLDANVLKKLGRDKEAIAAYEQALRLAGEAPPADPPAARPMTASDLPYANGPGGLGAPTPATPR